MKVDTGCLGRHFTAKRRGRSLMTRSLMHCCCFIFFTTLDSNHTAAAMEGPSLFSSQGAEEWELAAASTPASSWRAEGTRRVGWCHGDHTASAPWDATCSK